MHRAPRPAIGAEPYFFTGKKCCFIGMDSILRVGWFLLPGAANTIAIAVASFPLALVVAVLVTIPRLQRWPVVSPLLDWYVDFVRTTPLMLHIFFVFYGLPFAGVRLEPVTAGILTLSLHVGAYQSEMLSSAYNSVPIRLLEAASVLGMSNWVRLVRVVGPLALRVALPALANSLIEIVLNTVVLSVVTVQDIFFRRTMYIYQFYSGRLESLLLVSAFFISICIPAAWAVRQLERVVALPGDGTRTNTIKTSR